MSVWNKGEGAEFTKKLSRTNKAVRALADHWATTLGMRWFEDFKIQTYNTRNDLPEDHGQYPTCGFATVMWEYKKATVGFCLEMLVELSPVEIERVIVHEICHVLVNAMREYEKMGIKVEEMVVTNLTQALLWGVGEYRQVRFKGPPKNDREYGEQVRRLIHGNGKRKRN